MSDKRMFTVPNGVEVPIDDNNYITTKVVLDVGALIDHDLEGFLDLLSLGATDTEVLSDINYRALSITPQECIVFEVTGSLDLILEMESAQ